jgi:hypothetical protein
MVNALNSPSKETWQYVKFTRVSDSVVLGAFTDRDSNDNFEGTAYTSMPAMEIQLPENDGLLGEAPCTIKIQRLAGFLSEVSSGLPHAQVYVDVVEFFKAEAVSSVVLRTFSGEVNSVKRNAAGAREFVQFSALPVKNRLQTITLGEPCNHQCINRLGDARCQIPLLVAPNRHTIQLASIDGTVVTATTAITSSLQDRFYQRGYMLHEGLEIGIQDWRNEIEGDKQVFFMNRRPPSSWLGVNVILFAGCDKTIETCRTRFASGSNEAQFNGRGHHMPAYHPNFEDGGSRQ